VVAHLLQNVAIAFFTKIARIVFLLSWSVFPFYFGQGASASNKLIHLLLVSTIESTDLK
jgi:hypothetical protein